MNKVVLIIGSVTVIVVGGLFFFAGMFTGADLNTASIVTGKEAIQDEVAAKLKASVANFLGERGKTEIKVLETNDDHQMLDEDDLKPLQNSSKSGILFERPSPNVTIDTLLNEIISGHSTNDECLTNNVKTDQKENVVLNGTKGNVVFIGYFPTETAKQVSKLVMAKGYPSHVQISNATDAEAFVFCGPFKKESSATLLVSWLRKHDFKNAKIVKGSLLKSQKLNEEKLNEEAEALPVNLEKNKKAKPNSPKKKNAKENRNVKIQRQKTGQMQKTGTLNEVEEVFDEEKTFAGKTLAGKKKSDISQDVKYSSRNANIKQVGAIDENEEETELSETELSEIENSNENAEVNEITTKANERSNFFNASKNRTKAAVENLEEELANESNSEQVELMEEAPADQEKNIDNEEIGTVNDNQNSTENNEFDLEE